MVIPRENAHAIIAGYTRYLFAAVGIFTVGIGAGIALVVGGVDLPGLLGLDGIEELFPEELSATGILINNLQASLLMVLGGLTVGVLTAYALFANGVLIGYVVTPVVVDTGVGQALVLLLPHGIFELPAVFIAAAIGFRIAGLLVARLRGRRDRLRPSVDEQRQGAVLVGLSVLLLVVAAVIEVYVTPALFEAIYGTELEGI